MSFSSSMELANTAPAKPSKYAWYWAPIFCAFWFAIFYAAVIPSFHSFPKVLEIAQEHNHPDQFIGERAEIQLLGLSNIGVKLVGTPQNEVEAVNFLLNEIRTIVQNARTDLYDIEYETQFSSGEFMLWGMASVYQNVQNIVVKIAPKETNSTSYLLVNSHYDSSFGSPAAGDSGVMIVVMLETLRVISISEKPLENPIVFLLNGAEEIYLQGSHGFITSHRWAPFVKAVINLDSAGSGGREVLFQSGPNHPWLMKYYGESVPHPYATTIAEELFQNGFIPSDTDFRIFRDHGHIPGLDLAHNYNGYVYHTKYDRFSILPRGTYQTTGDNILALTRALANAPELRETEKHAEGHTVFFDYLGWFTVHYTEGVGLAINITVSVCALIMIVISFTLMLREKGSEPRRCLVYFCQIFLVQIVAGVVAIGLALLIGVILNAAGLMLSWYYNSWMIFGLYFCPIFFGLGIVPAFFLGWAKKKGVMSLSNSVKLFLHSHAIVIVLITLVMTGMNIRSAFFPMISLFFYTISMILDVLVTAITGKKRLWVVIHCVLQILPFWGYTYITYTFLNVFNEMQGRAGPENNPELFIGIITAIMCLHFAAFIIPILHFFRKSKLFFSVFAVVTIIFVIIAATPVGFPFQKDIAAKRIFVIHTNRVFHDYDGTVNRNESGFYVQPFDPRNAKLEDSVYRNANSLSYTKTNCEEEMRCGVPLYSTRWDGWISSSRWVPSVMPVLPDRTELKYLEKTILSDRKVRFSFSLSGADRSIMYVEPVPGAKVTDWSFNRTPLDDNSPTPYFIYSTYSMIQIPLEFWIELERDSETWEGPTVKIAVGGHMLHHQKYYTTEYKEFLESFPDWSYASAWIASHESWLF